MGKGKQTLVYYDLFIHVFSASQSTTIEILSNRMIIRISYTQQPWISGLDVIYKKYIHVVVSITR